MAQIVRSCSAILVICIMVRPGSTQYYGGPEGHGTVHEQMGQAHVPEVIYSQYKSQFKNYVPLVPDNLGLSPFYGFTHGFFKNLVHNKSMDGYISYENKSTLVLGRKAIENDWKPLLAKNKGLIIVLLIFLILVIAMPFIAVCYCCFCCCRCRKTCPPCTSKRDARRRLCCSILLVILLIGLIIGFFIAFLANKLINRGTNFMAHRQRSTGKEICAYLKDVTDHVDHLFIVNYNEIEAHAIEQATGAFKHLLLDLSDTSGGDALSEMERILDNMGQASAIMKEVDQMQKELRFIAATLRDAFRGYKRNMALAYTVYCPTIDCLNNFRASKIMTYDSSICLHLDKLPNSTQFWEAMDKSVDEHLSDIAKKGMGQMAVVGQKLHDATAPILPPLKTKLDNGGREYISQDDQIRKHINSTINDIYKGSYGTIKSFQDIYDRFGYHRNVPNVIVCLFLIVIIILLIVGLIWGLCVRTNNIGSTALLFAIMIIFSVFSFITIVGLFHLMVGMITSLGVCRSDEVPTNHTLPANLKGCGKSGTIFNLLKSQNKYDVNVLKNIQILEENDEETSWHDLHGDLSTASLISDKDVVRMKSVLENLYSFRSTLYTSVMCTPPATPNVGLEAQQEYNRAYNVLMNEYHWGRYPRAWYAIVYIRQDLQAHEPLEQKFAPQITAIEDKLKIVDSLICKPNLNFNDTFQPLITSVVRAQEFLKNEGRTYINSLGKNLTDSIQQQLGKFSEMVITECTYHVGSCQKLGNIYSHDMEFLCQNLIAPINAYWVGVLLSSLLLIPTLIVAHYLMCLYRVHKVYAPPVLHLTRDDNCPACSGGPVVPRPIVICSGGQQSVPYDVRSVDSSSSINKRKRE